MRPATKLMWTETSRETSGEHHPTFVMICNEDMLKKYKKTPGSVPLVEVLQTFDIWHFVKPGHEGKMERPSHDMLKEYFGTTNENAIAEFMIKNGYTHNLGHDPLHPDRGNELKNPSRGHGITGTGPNHVHG